MSSKENPNEQNLLEEEAGADTFFAESSLPQGGVDSEKSGKKRMSKNIKMMLAGIVALVVLGGTLTTVLVMQSLENSTNEESEEDSTDEEEEDLTLNAEVGDDVVQVEIHGKSDFLVYRVSEATDEEDAVYTIEGWEDLNLSSNLINTLVNNGSELEAYELVEENCDDLSKYGLDDPIAEVAITYEDGTVFEFAIGDANPLSSTYTYCLVNDVVYLIKTSLMTNYKQESTYFVLTTVLEEPDDDDYPIVNYVRVEREDLEYDIYLEYGYYDDDSSNGGTAATHIMYEPIFSYLDLESSSDVTNGMFGLSADVIAVIHPTDEDIETTGLNDPYCTVTMDCDDGSTYYLYFGNTYEVDDTTYYYCYLEGDNVIYGITEDSAVWLTVIAGDITSSNIFASYVWDIATLDVVLGDEELHFVGEGEDSDTYVVTKNGEDIDNERFRLFYRFLLVIYGEELAIGEEIPDVDPECSIHVITQDGSEDYTVEFYKLSNIYTLVTFNGVPSYRIRTSCLDTILYNMQIFDTDEDFLDSWQ